MSHKFDAVCFDLLSALLNSWSLWDELAGDSTLGREWRIHYLEAARNTERYEPYIQLIGESAKAVGIAKAQADKLADRWNELTPWPEAKAIVAEIASATKVGVITNCSETMGVAAANTLGVHFDVVVTAERAGFYKPDLRTYEKAIEEIGEAPARILYVAGSPYDVSGAAATGMPVYWHNRIGLVDTEASSTAIGTSDSLEGLLNFIA